MYDVIGHFGSRLSYATVGAAVCRGLRDAGLLASVTNLDDKTLPDYEDLVALKGAGTHAILFVDPARWLFDAMASKYGAHNVAVFASPNTDSMLEERTDVCSRAGMVLAPSQWCIDTVSRSLKRHGLGTPPWLCRVPLGVSPEYLGAHERHVPGKKLRLLHLGTDYSWPGRKGTEELLKAWAMVQAVLEPVAELVIHVPSVVYEPVHYAVADAGLEGVQILLAPPRGSSDAQLVSLYEQADVVVLPSRCEGFGMMMLAACVAGVPLMTTYVTGQIDFLTGLDGWLGVPCSDRMEPMEHEQGLCPVVEPTRIASALLAVCSPMVLDHLREGAKMNASRAPAWCWDASVKEWVETLELWRKQT